MIQSVDDGHKVSKVTTKLMHNYTSIVVAAADAVVVAAVVVSSVGRSC